MYFQVFTLLDVKKEDYIYDEKAYENFVSLCLRALHEFD